MPCKAVDFNGRFKHGDVLEGGMGGGWSRKMSCREEQCGWLLVQFLALPQKLPKTPHLA